MINLPHEQCYGCQGCLNICPQDAIFMVEDEYGYRYPQINLGKCVDCDLCKKVCPELNQITLNSPIKILAAQSKNKDVFRTTASGGVCYSLSIEIINRGGIVYGCAEKDFQTIKHIRVDCIDDLNQLKNSKYVHSDINHTYREARKDLNMGRLVLFTGTPCQISGLKMFLRKQYDNLITVDLICHGVPPMKMLREQVLSYPEVKHVKPEDIFVDFRWKSSVRSGCHDIRYGLRTKVRSGSSFRVIREENDIINAYMRCFQTGISLRDNCLRCPYAKRERVSDITAADFWGLGSDKIPSDLVASKGVSLLLINTKVGNDLFNSIKSDFEVRKQSYEEAKLFNRCLYAPFKYHPKRDAFLKLYKTQGLIKATTLTDSLYRFETTNIVRRCNSILILRKCISLIKIVAFKLGIFKI